MFGQSYALSTVSEKEILLEDVKHFYLTGGLNCLPIGPIFILLSIREVEETCLIIS